VVVEGRPRDERELAHRAQRGDVRAFEQLVEPHKEIAFRVAYLITRNAPDAEDATQEALLKTWRTFTRFRVGSPLRPWLLRITANEARNRRRSDSRAERLAMRAAATSSGEAAPSPEETALAADERERLLDALEQLPDGFRAVLECRYLLELSEEETAATLDIRRGTVKSRTARALERLREMHESRA
jgi:RNA polymerase sigma-70 factor (ECF subfamily)